MGSSSLQPHSNSHTRQLDFAVLEQAANWYAILQSPRANNIDMQRWQVWRDTCEAHQVAWQRVEVISGKFTSLPANSKPGARTILDQASQQHGMRRKSLKVLLLCTTGAIITSIGTSISWQSLFASYKTTTGAQQEIRLADGSRLWLNTDSAVDIRFTDIERTIILHHGEMLIQTAKETQRPYRPLVVRTSYGQFQALGTRFNLFQHAHGVNLSVLEGAVKIQPINPALPANIVHAGQQTQIDTTAIAASTDISPSRGHWIRRQIFADNITLGELIDELSRYRTGIIRIDPKVSNIRVIGVYNTANTDQVLAALAGTLPIRITHTLPWWVSITAQ